MITTGGNVGTEPGLRTARTRSISAGRRPAEVLLAPDPGMSSLSSGARRLSAESVIPSGPRGLSAGKVFARPAATAPAAYSWHMLRNDVGQQ